MLRSGAYFEDSRQWYQALYIGPIAERSFFLIIAGLASLVALAGIIAATALLPITTREGLLLANKQMDEKFFFLAPMDYLAFSVSDPVLGFYLSSYVRSQFETYHYEKKYAFVRAHSDTPTFQQFVTNYAATNPESPLNVLARGAEQRVEVTNITLNTAQEPYVASVQFRNHRIENGVRATEQWTATIGYYYSPLEVTSVRDVETGALRTQTKEPVFQVVQYAVSKATTSN